MFFERAIINLKFKKFLLQYSSKYEKGMLNYIKNNFWILMDEERIPSILKQVYSEVGVYENRDNFYLEHLKKINENFDIRCNILDIGSGVIPAFANLVAKEQLKLGSGTITLYDPMLITNKSKHRNMKLNKKKFKSRTDITNYDLITGIMPCEATSDLIEAACKNKKDFYLAMCGCTHKKGSSYDYMDPSSYQNYIIEKTKKLLKKYNNGILVVDKLDDKFNIPYPILYNKKS